MKNAVWFVIIVLLLWNILLSVSLNDLNSQNSGNDIETVVIENTVNGYITDITKVVANSDAQAVTVKSMIGENEYFASGFIYRNNASVAYIVTNHHVVSAIENISVIFDNGEEVPAFVYGYDEYYDIAVLKTEINFNVTSAKLGDSSILNKGEFVIAIGSPIDDRFEGTVSVGVVSGTDRLLPIDVNDDGIDDFEVSGIQTDANITSGNSGGPLLNMSGEVVGINTMSIKPYTSGMNFAIAIDEVKVILESIMNEQEIFHPQIHFEGQNIDGLSNYQKSFYGIPLDQLDGIYVEEVDSGSSYEVAGLTEGDIVYGLDGVEITDMIELRTTLFNYQEGVSAKLNVIRNNERIELTVIVE